jgi:hypothetical protein
MDNRQDSAEKAVAGLKKFEIVGSRHVHSLLTWVAVGLLLGVLVAVAYVSNKSARFDAGLAANTCPLMQGPFSFAGHGTAQAWMSVADYNTYLRLRAGATYEGDGEQYTKLAGLVEKVKMQAVENCVTDLGKQKADAYEKCDANGQDCLAGPSACSFNTTEGTTQCRAATCAQAGDKITCDSYASTASMSCTCDAKAGVQTQIETPPNDPSKPMMPGTGDEPFGPSLPTTY